MFQPRQRSAGPALRSPTELRVPRAAGSFSLHSPVRTRTRKQGEGERGTECSLASSSPPAVAPGQPGGCPGGLRGGIAGTGRAPLPTTARRALSPQAPPHRELCRGPPPSPLRPIRARKSLIDFCCSQSALCLPAPNQTPGDVFSPNDEAEVELGGGAHSFVSGVRISQSEQGGVLTGDQ